MDGRVLAAAHMPDATRQSVRRFTTWLRARAATFDAFDADRRAQVQAIVGAVIVVAVAAGFAVLPVARGGVAVADPVRVVAARAAGDGTDRSGGGDAAGGPAAATVDGPAPAPPTSPPAPPAPTVAPAVVDPATRGALPIGKGMWIWQPDQTEGGDAAAIVARAVAVGLTHVFVRTGSSFDGFYAQDFLNRILPAAHAAGIRVYGWDVPYLKNGDDDVARAVAAITYTTPDGQRLDGFAADMEIGDGQNMQPIPAFTYGVNLRHAVGGAYPLIACVPRPNPALVTFPFPEVVAAFDAIAPMVYWLGNDPAAAVESAVAGLAQFGKPILPVGQAYDGGSEGGPPGVPSRDELLRFFDAGDRAGADGYSFWDWQEATPEAWDAIRDAPQGMLPAAGALAPGQARGYRALVASLGYPSVADFQRAAHLPVTGAVDLTTRRLLLTPRPPPVHPE